MVSTAGEPRFGQHTGEYGGARRGRYCQQRAGNDLPVERALGLVGLVVAKRHRKILVGDKLGFHSHCGK